MTIVHVDTLTIRRAQIADILAEGQRRIEAGDPSAPAEQQPGESNAAYALRLADFFIQMACEQAAFEVFDRDVFVMHMQQRRVGSDPR